MKIYKYKGIETNYEVSKKGKVRNRQTKHIISQWSNKAGYMYVTIYIDGKSHNIAVHTMVAETFIPNPENKPTVNHKNIHNLNSLDNKKDNNVENLEWATYSENNKHAYEAGLKLGVCGERVHFSKTKDAVVKHACELLVSGLTIIEVSNLTGITPKILYEIRNKRIWKHISSQYTFKKVRSQYSENYSNELRDMIIMLVGYGYSNKEICKMLGLEKTKKLSKSIHDIRYRRRKVQRPVVTDDDNYYNININM